MALRERKTVLPVPTRVYSISVDTGTLYAGTSQGVFAHRISDGSEIWRTDDRDPFSGTPAVVDGVVFIGCGDVMSTLFGAGHPGYTGHIHAFDAKSGRELWSYPTPDWIDSSAVVVKGVVYIGCRDRKLYALDARDGRKRWSFEAKFPVRTTPVVFEGIVYLNVDTRLHALDAVSGTPLWSFQASNEAGYPPSTPAVTGEAIFFSYANIIYALETSTGRERWSFSAGDDDWVDVSPSVAVGMVYLSGADRIWALDDASGRVIWTRDYHERGKNVTYGNYADPAPAVAGGTIYLGNIWGQLYALDAETGEERWAMDIGGYVRSSPVVVGGTVFIGSDNGYIFAIDRLTGMQLWKVYHPLPREQSLREMIGGSRNLERI